jgi:dethiobiotin synthetase
MKQAFFITGTDTGVGKTRIATGLVHGFTHSGRRVVGMKPVAAGAMLQDGYLLNDDVVQLIAASNVEAPLSLINPYVFEPPVAPHIAAAQAGISMSIPKLKSDFKSLGDAADVVVVEGAGGFLVPLNDSEDMADLAMALGLPVILVVGMRLGCLNHALLTVAAIEARGLRLAGWVANHIDPQMMHFSENLESLKQRITAPCLGVVPYSISMDFRQVSAYLELPA